MTTKDIILIIFLFVLLISMLVLVSYLDDVDKEDCRIECLNKGYQFKEFDFVDDTRFCVCDINSVVIIE